MGTNYFVKTKKCKHCGYKPEWIHLGKSSAGWQFTFQYNGGKYYQNVEEMKEWLKDKIIIDENNRKVSNESFWKMVDEKQKNYTKNHAKLYPNSTNIVINGYSFTDTYFS